MISHTTRSFRRALAKLSKADRRAAKVSFRLFLADPSHPSLHFKKLSGFDDVWSVRASIDLRAVAHREGDSLSWAWIGSHNDFDNLFG